MRTFLLAATALSLLAAGTGCNRRQEVQSVSGVKMTSVGSVQTDEKGHTAEQANVVARIAADNEIGKLRHLYCISPYSGQVILYSPVKGKVTSTSKRLTPRNITGNPSNQTAQDLPIFPVGSLHYTTSELPNEDGTYGSSVDALFWFTPQGEYRQHLLTGGQIIHISDNPIQVKGVTVTTETLK